MKFKCCKFSGFHGGCRSNGVFLSPDAVLDDVIVVTFREKGADQPDV